MPNNETQFKSSPEIRGQGRDMINSYFDPKERFIILLICTYRKLNLKKQINISVKIKRRYKLYKNIYDNDNKTMRPEGFI